MERGRELGHGASSSSLLSPQFKFTPPENSHWLPVLCQIKPQLDFSIQDWCFLFYPILSDLPSWPSWPSGHALYSLRLSPSCQSPYSPAEPGLVSTRSVSTHWLASVPKGDRLIWGCGFPGVGPSFSFVLPSCFRGPLTCPALSN